MNQSDYKMLDIKFGEESLNLLSAHRFSLHLVMQIQL